MISGGPGRKRRVTSGRAIRGRGRGRGVQGNSSDDDAKRTRISKAMSWALRHGADELRLPMAPDGFVAVDALLAALARGSRALTGVSLADVERIVTECPKQRFALSRTGAGAGGGALRIRANQGHTLRRVHDEALLTRVRGAAEAPVCVHGTYERAWRGPTGIATAGLSRMARNHVHFATGLPGEDGVRSGMRGDVQLLIYVDVGAAMAAGLEFLRSQNGVLLCAGDARGIISPRFFHKVMRVSDGTELLLQCAAAATAAPAAASGAAPTPALDPNDTKKLKELKPAQMKDQLKARGLSTQGNKKELFARLLEACEISVAGGGGGAWRPRFAAGPPLAPAVRGHGASTGRDRGRGGLGRGSQGGGR
eukprot:g7489.t1